MVGISLTHCKPKLRKVVDQPEGSDTRTEYQVDEYELRQGESVTYIDDVLYERSMYKDGELHGDRYIYFPDGQTEIHERYDSGLLNDTLRIYYPSGQIKLKLYYEYGDLTGQSQKYYEDGVLAETATFKDNEENGPFVEYHPNGNIKWQGNYLNGDNEFGELLNYDESGALIKKMICDSLAICRTVWTKENGDIEPQ